MSETLIDNYDPSQFVAEGNGGTAGTPAVGGATQFTGFLEPVSITTPPAFVVVSGGTTSTGAGGASSGTRTGVGGSFLVRGGAGSGLGLAGASATPVPVHRAVPNDSHTLSRYMAFDVATSGEQGIPLGMTANDHLVAVTSHYSVLGMHSLDGASLERIPALLELSSDGDVIRFVAFTVAIMPDAFAVNPRGQLALAGGVHRFSSFGGAGIRPTVNGYYLAALDRDWLSTLEDAHPTDDAVKASAVSLDDGGAIYLGLSEGSAASLQAFEASGEPRFRSTLRPTSEGSISIASLVVGDNGRIHAVGSFEGSVTIDDRAIVGKGQSDGWVAEYDAATGALRNVAEFGGATHDIASVVIVTPEGHRRFGGQISGRAELFGATLSVSTRGTPFLCDLDVDGRLGWVTLLGEAGTVAAVAHRNGRTYVAGHLYGTNSADPMRRSKLYVAQIEPDGTVSSMFTTDSSGDSATRVAVSAANEIWLSGRADLVPYQAASKTDSIVLLQLLPNSTHQ